MSTGRSRGGGGGGGRYGGGEDKCYSCGERGHFARDCRGGGGGGGGYGGGRGRRDRWELTYFFVFGPLYFAFLCLRSYSQQNFSRFKYIVIYPFYVYKFRFLHFKQFIKVCYRKFTSRFRSIYSQITDKACPCFLQLWQYCNTLPCYREQRSQSRHSTSCTVSFSCCAALPCITRQTAPRLDFVASFHDERH